MTEAERLAYCEELTARVKEERLAKQRAYNRKYEAQSHIRGYRYAKNKQWWDENSHMRTEYRLQRLYGISKETRDEMFEKQGRVCAVCKACAPGTSSGWNVDHCHSTKKVRGVLCHHCNATLGAAKDDVPRLLKLVEYLKSNT